MGACVGRAVGRGDGDHVEGNGVGTPVGAGLGYGVGPIVGTGVGYAVGDGVGTELGKGVGPRVGTDVGVALGSGVGWLVLRFPPSRCCSLCSTTRNLRPLIY